MENLVINEIRMILGDPSVTLTGEAALIGDNRIIDSTGLVELCLRLEDKAISMGFEFDWTSETAMSKSRGMFRTIGALQDEFMRQKSSRE